MSLEVLNTIGTLTTVVIVAATAIAALVQLRHLRAGNQINAMLDIGEKMSTKSFDDAIDIVRQRLDQAIRDPAYREYETALSLGQSHPHVDPSYSELRRATLVIGNFYEELGILVRRGSVDRDMFLDGLGYRILTVWKRLEPLTALSREVTSPLAWENFEYLAVLSEDWLNAHSGGTYPPGVRRMQLTNPWPVAAASAT
jgi:hypothetical protein